MIKIAELVPFIERALSDIDTTLYIPRVRQRGATVPLPWRLAAVIWFSASGMSRWKPYVNLLLPMWLSKYKLSYSQWSFWRKELAALVQVLAEVTCIKSAYRGVALVDSTCLPVCAIQRERDHKCFAKHASKGHGSLGWFFGFKLHLVTSDTGEILRFWLSTGKVHDTAPLFHVNFMQGLQGLLVGDSGYRVGKKRADGVARNSGLALIARPVGVEDKDMPWTLRSLFKDRWRIETVFDELKDACGLNFARRCKTLETLQVVVHSSLIAYTAARCLAPS